MNYKEILNQSEEGMKDYVRYFTFLIKTLIDDFGEHLNEAAEVNKEQFEAEFLSKLNIMITDKTRVEKDGK